MDREEHWFGWVKYLQYSGLYRVIGLYRSEVQAIYLPHVGSFNHLRSPSIPIYAIRKELPPHDLSLADNINYKSSIIISSRVQRSA